MTTVLGLLVGYVIVAVGFGFLAWVMSDAYRPEEEPIWIRHRVVFASTWPAFFLVFFVLSWSAYLRELKGADPPPHPPEFLPSRVNLGGFAITREGDGYRKAAMDEQGARDILGGATAGATHAAALLVHQAQLRNAWGPVALQDVIASDDPFVVVWRRNASFTALAEEGYAAWTNDGGMVFTGKAYKALAHHLVMDESIPGKRRVS